MAHPLPMRLYKVYNQHTQQDAGHFEMREGPPRTFSLWAANGILWTDGTLSGGPPVWVMTDGQGAYVGEYTESATLPVIISSNLWPTLTHQLI